MIKAKLSQYTFIEVWEYKKNAKASSINSSSTCRLNSKNYIRHSLFFIFTHIKIYNLNLLNLPRCRARPRYLEDILENFSSENLINWIYIYIFRSFTTNFYNYIFYYSHFNFYFQIWSIWATFKFALFSHLLLVHMRK